jgi:hypothetical protein
MNSHSNYIVVTQQPSAEPLPKIEDTCSVYSNNESISTSISLCTGGSTNHETLRTPSSPHQPGCTHGRPSSPDSLGQEALSAAREVLISDYYHIWTH